MVMPLIHRARLASIGMGCAALEVTGGPPFLWPYFQVIGQRRKALISGEASIAACDLFKELTDELERMQDEQDTMAEVCDDLRKLAEYRKQPCPDERAGDEPGYTQGEARFWHERTDELNTEVRRLEAELRNEQRAHRAHEAGQAALERRVKDLEQQVEHWKKKFHEKIFSNDM